MMKFLTKETSNVVDNAVEMNNNKKDGFDNRADTLSPSNSVLSPSQSNCSDEMLSPAVKTPTHFHHPEYIKEIVDNEKAPMVASARHVIVNLHPESGVDRSSLLDQRQTSWQSSSPERRSWYSRWDGHTEKVEVEKIDKVKEEKRKRNTEEILKLPCTLGKMVLVEQERQEANIEKHIYDPRLTSRSPNASSPLHSKTRFKSSINSSPSRTLREARDQTKSVQCLTEQRDGNMNIQNTTSNEVHVDNGTFIVVNQDKIPKGVSMPEIAAPIKLFPYHVLSTLNPRLPKGVDRTRLEQHLTYKEFQQIFGMPRDEFWRQPKWKKMEMKKKVHLF